MKSFKILASALAVAALALTGCVKNNLTETGIDINKPGVAELTYADVAHGSKGLTVLWDATDAVAAGAASFTVQMVEDKAGDAVNMYDASKSTTVPVEKDENGVPVKTSYSATVSGQNVGDIYFVRVRVNYPASIYSQWAFLSDEQGNIVRYKVGRGIIPDNALETPYLYKVTPTSSGIIVKWDKIPGVKKYIVEYKKTADSDWIQAELGPDEVNFKIKDLPSVTAYQVRAKADYGDPDKPNYSAYCETVDVTTRQPGSYPAQMTSKEQLIAWLEGGIVEVEAGQTYEIMNDIDLAEEAFTAMDEPLMGIFNGNGHKITGVASTLFDTNEGTIKNVIVEGKGINLEGTPEFGAFIRKNSASGVIENCSINVPVTFETATDVPIYIGGFCYINEGSIKGCSNKGAVTVKSTVAAKTLIFIGGFACKCLGTLEECVNEGAVSYTNENQADCPAVAGIAAFLGGSAKSCINKGSIVNSILYSTTAGTLFPEEIASKKSATATYMTPAVGGIVAYSYSEDITTPLLDECVNDGAVTLSVLGIDKYTTTVQRVQAGGIIANPWGLIKNCINNGAFTVEIKTTTGSASTGTYLTCAGGIGGGDWFPGAPNDQAATTYDGCVNNGEINYIKFDKKGSSNSTVGGIVGWPGLEGSRSNETKNCVNNGKINISGTGKMRCGGIHGGSGKVTGCENYGTVYFQSGDDASAIGGISGFSSNGFKITKCKSCGTVMSDIPITYGVSGIVGNLGNSKGSGGFADCIVSCKVINPEGTNEHTGMLIGYYNGTSADVPVATPQVNGIIGIGGKNTTLTAGNFTSYLVGTANASATAHTVAATFYGVPYVDPDGPGQEDDPTTKLDNPKNVAVSILYNSVTISWDAVDKAEWYIVEYKKKADEAWQSTERIVDKTSVTIEGLAHGTDYSFRVKAFSSVSSGYSDVVDQKTYDEVNLAKPVLSAGTIEATAITVNWAAVANAKGYKLQYKLASDGDFTMAPVELAADALTYTLKGLIPETDYEFRVKATGEGGNEGEYCDPFTVKTDKVNITYPFTINTVSDFELWAAVASACVSTDEIILGADIDLSGKTIDPIASFAGIFNGNGKTIKNYTGTAALFTENNGTIKDLTVTGAVTAAAQECAVIVKTNNGTMSGVVNKASLTYNSSASTTGINVLAGVASYSFGPMTGCSNEGAISFTVNGTCESFGIAGVAAYIEDAMENCSNSGKITVSAQRVTKKVKIANVPQNNGCGCAGGIFCYAGSGSTVSNSNNSGNIDYLISNIDAGTSGINRNQVAGVIAAPAGDITNCKNTGKIVAKFLSSAGAAFSAQEYICGVGGISGGDYFSAGSNESNIKDCTNEGDIDVTTDSSKSNSTVGGIVAWPGVEGDAQTIVTSNCVNKGNVTISGFGKGRFGGIQGGAGNVRGCKNYGTITNNTNVSGSCVGGISGYRSGTITVIEDCENYGDVVNTHADLVYTGALIGAWGGQDFNTGAGCIAKGNLVLTAENEENALKYSGMVIGRFNGDKLDTLGSSEKPITVGGSFSLNGNKVDITADNYTSYATGNERIISINGSDPSCNRQIYIKFE